jgi:hypothetical protein
MRRTAAQSLPTVNPPGSARRNPIPVGAGLLGMGGVALVGAGALLGWQRGAMVSLGESVLATIAWCF